jgi:hypothetical protein
VSQPHEGGGAGGGAVEEAAADELGQIEIWEGGWVTTRASGSGCVFRAAFTIKTPAVCLPACLTDQLTD